MSTDVMPWSNSKPDVEFQYDGRLAKFYGMSSQSHLPHCRVLPPGEFNVMIQSYVSHWRCCHRANSTACYPRATYHIAGCCHLVNSPSWFQSHMPHCSHLAKSMLWSCHIAGCNNSIRHIENRFRHILFFNAVWDLTNGGFRIVSDTLVVYKLKVKSIYI